jgi:hypothetical protein
MKSVKNDKVLAIVALGVFSWFLYTVYNNKNSTNYMTSSYSSPENQYSVPSPSTPLGQNDMYAKASGVKTNTYGMHPSTQTLDDPSQLLPNDANKQWSNLNPQGNGQLQNVALLNPGFLTGINTVGSTKRNKNLQDRSEYVIPQTNVGPWNQSTIEPDLLRKPLELGQGAL